MELYESKKNVNGTQNKEERNIGNAKQSDYENEHFKKALLLDKSEYGWDGDY